MDKATVTPTCPQSERGFTYSKEFERELSDAAEKIITLLAVPWQRVLRRDCERAGVPLWFAMLKGGYLFGRDVNDIDAPDLQRRMSKLQFRLARIRLAAGRRVEHMSVQRYYWKHQVKETIEHLKWWAKKHPYRKEARSRVR